MPVSHLDIHHSAHRWVEIHGNEAVAKARAKVEERRRQGDSEGADFWLRIIVAIGTLSERLPSVGALYIPVDVPKS